MERVTGSYSDEFEYQGYKISYTVSVSADCTFYKGNKVTSWEDSYDDEYEYDNLSVNEMESLEVLSLTNGEYLEDDDIPQDLVDKAYEEAERIDADEVDWQYY